MAWGMPNQYKKMMGGGANARPSLVDQAPPKKQGSPGGFGMASLPRFLVSNNPISTGVIGALFGKKGNDKPKRGKPGLAGLEDIDRDEATGALTYEKDGKTLPAELYSMGTGSTGQPTQQAGPGMAGQIPGFEGNPEVAGIMAGFSAIESMNMPPAFKQAATIALTSRLLTAMDPSVKAMEEEKKVRQQRLMENANQFNSRMAPYVGRLPASIRPMYEAYGNIRTREMQDASQFVDNPATLEAAQNNNRLAQAVQIAAMQLQAQQQMAQGAGNIPGLFDPEAFELNK